MSVIERNRKAGWRGMQALPHRAELWESLKRRCIDVPTFVQSRNQLRPPVCTHIRPHLTRTNERSTGKLFLFPATQGVCLSDESCVLRCDGSIKMPTWQMNIVASISASANLIFSLEVQDRMGKTCEECGSLVPKHYVICEGEN